MQGMMISAREENNETGIKKNETHDADKQRGRLLNLCLHSSVIQIQITIALLRSNHHRLVNTLWCSSWAPHPIFPHCQSWGLLLQAAPPPATSKHRQGNASRFCWDARMHRGRFKHQKPCPVSGQLGSAEKRRSGQRANLCKPLRNWKMGPPKGLRKTQWKQKTNSAWSQGCPTWV